MPLLITRQHLANTVAERFRVQYEPHFETQLFGDSRATYKSLLALGETPSVDAVENVMEGWTRLNCDECGKSVESLVQVGQEPDYESSTASICIDCATAALKLFEAQ